jgi:hypothetical protein
VQPSITSGLELAGEFNGDGLHGRLWGLHEKLWGVSCFQPSPGLFMNEVSRSNRIDNVLSLQVCKFWARADLFFLKDSLERGMSLAEIAGFLRRTADEVREKAKDLTGESAATEARLTTCAARHDLAVCAGIAEPCGAPP